MGASSSGVNLTIEQIKSYYIFQTKLKSILIKGKNPFYDSKILDNNIEKIYIINKDWIENWKSISGYNIAFDSFKNITVENKEKLIKRLDIICDSLKKNNVIKYKTQPFGDNISPFKSFIQKSNVEPEDFDNLVDENTYKLFKKIGKNSYFFSTKTYYIEGIITDEIIILFIEKFFSIKIFYLEKIENNENKELIQFVANFLDPSQGRVSEPEKGYEYLKNFLLKRNSEKIKNFFKEQALTFLQEKTLIINSVKCIITNQNLQKKYFEKERIRAINFQNVDKIRKIGLANVGATCYMNATLQCFINIDSLTRYLLNETNYNKIINNFTKCELTSEYCQLLAKVCCDENIINYYEPQKFKDIISSKNPLFKGINANDSKDLINFLLEEMNHELSELNQIKNDNHVAKNTSNQIDQTNQYLVLNYFKSEFIKNNNSIISEQFFFIIENQTKCQFCNTIKYNFQALYLLEFPLEVVYNFSISNNINPINNKGEIVINLYQCFEQYRSPSFFTGENRFYCNICNEQRDSIYLNNIYSLPPVLIIILNRGKGKSFNCKVDFYEELNLHQYITCPQSIANYNLKGVITHLGESGMGGHFIAYCKYRLDNKWYCYNDSIVTLCEDQKNGFRVGTPYICGEGRVAGR